MQELRNKYLLQSLVSKQYQGEINKKNDTVRVSQINKPSTTLKTVGTDADTYNANKLSTSYVDVVANKRATSAFEFDDLIEVQSIIDPTKNPEIRTAMVDDIGEQIDTYLKSLISPSAASPDHILSGNASMTSAVLLLARNAAAAANWGYNTPWYMLMGSTYYGGLLSDTTLAGADYGATDQPIINGRVSIPRYNFSTFEDPSLTAAYGLGFIPDWLLFVQQTEVRFKISDLHSNSQFGYAMSADVVFGCKTSIDGDVKHLTITT